jgi:hypothetical protein
VSVLLLQILLGLEPDREARALCSEVHALPDWTARVEKGSVLPGPS